MFSINFSMTLKLQQLALLTLILLLFHTQQTILVTSPAINPFDDSQIPYSYTNVGNIPYGKTLTFDLVEKPDIDFCTNPLKSNVTALVDPTYVVIEPTNFGCSFVSLALNAQQLGAKGVVIVSDLVNYFNKMIPIDDGNGRKVHISVVLINNITYQKLKVIKNVHIKVQYQIYKSQAVNFKYFLSASGRANYIFLREFQPYYEKVVDYINFEPIYLTIQCPNCQPKDCLVSGDYCMFQMDTYADGVGEYILKEQIRQYNVWRNFGTGQYFKYMNEFDKYCTTKWVDSESCGYKIMKDLDILNASTIVAPTKTMDDWRKIQVASGFLTTPELTINAELYAGTENSTDVFSAICASLLSPPTSCFGDAPNTGNKGSKMGWIIASIIIACLLSMALGFVIYRKCVKKQLTKDMFSKVNQLVARYATKVSEHNKKRKDKLKLRLNEEL